MTRDEQDQLVESLLGISDLTVLGRRWDWSQWIYSVGIGAEEKGPLDAFMYIVASRAKDGISLVLFLATELQARTAELEECKRQRDAAFEQLKTIGRKAFWASK